MSAGFVIVNDLAGEGAALVAILGALSKLSAVSQQRCLHVVESLVPPQQDDFRDFVRRPANGTADEEVATNLERLRSLQGDGDEEAP